MGGYGTSQILRLANNILLARLISPDIFGFMAIVTTILSGIEMISDMGIGPSIIQNKMGDEPRFLKTAWTLQLGRGTAIWAIICLLAWPAALIYGQPELLYVMPVIGLSNFLSSFNSTSLFSLNRHLKMPQLILFDLVTQILSIIVILTVAYFYPTVWALVIGSLSYSLVRLIGSYLVFPTFAHSFTLDPEAKASLVKFGKGVVMSSALTFVAGQLDILLIGFLFPLTTLGLYTISLGLAKAPNELARHLTSKIAFPWLASIHRESDIDKTHLFKMRLSILVPTALMLVTLSLISKPLIHTLYKPIYWDAAWMLKWLALGFVPAAVNYTSGIVWMAMGNTAMIARLLFYHILLFVPLILLGYHYGHEQGVVIIVSIMEIFFYPLQAYFLHKHKLWQPALDIPIMAASYSAVLTFG